MSDFGFLWLYNLVIWSAWIWGIGNLIRFSLYVYPIVKSYSEEISEKVESKISSEKKESETDSK